MATARTAVIWIALAMAVVAPLVAAGFSPLLAWRDTVYIAAGFAGILAMALLLVQPLLASRLLPGLEPRRARRVHRWVGITVLLAVLAHVAGLWITSPPDVIDALLFVSPTPFAIWGVLAMWALFATGVLALLRRRGRIRWRLWRLGHVGLAVVIVGGTIVHAALIQGTMEPISKYLLSALLVLAILPVLLDLRTR